MWRVAMLLVSGCGRISFDIVQQGVDDAAADGSGDGSPGDGPGDGPMVRACHTDVLYQTANGLANTYREGTPLVTWQQARLDCLTDDADLWVVESSLEQNAFTGDWTGITDEINENQWRELDGSVATFLPFIGGEPNGGTGENCIRTDPAGFEDRACTDTRDYVCECPAP